MDRSLTTGDGQSTGYIDSERIRSHWLLPAGGVLGAMALGFASMGALLLAREQVILASPITQWIAVAIMYLVPHLVAGAWIGSRQGVALEPPIAATVAPVLVLVLALAVFGGPVSTPVQALPMTIGAMVIWGLAFTVGMVAGDRFDLRPNVV